NSVITESQHQVTTKLIHYSSKEYSTLYLSIKTPSALFSSPLRLCEKKYSYSTQSTNFTSPHGKVIKAIFQQNKQPHELCKNGYQLSVSVKMV
ncbi:MAG: hypothetical protein ACK5RD_04785, partial [Aphanizomenon sp.]